MYLHTVLMELFKEKLKVANGKANLINNYFILIYITVSSSL